MWLLRAAWPLLALPLIADAGAALRVTDCLEAGPAQVAAASGDCAQLERLSAVYSRTVRSDLPDPARLDPILAEIGQTEAPKSLWELFQEWVRARLRELQAALPEIGNPLAGLELPGWVPGVVTGIGVVLLAGVCLVGLAALVRALLSRRAAVGSAIQGLLPGTRAGPPVRSPTFADVEGAPPAERPRILLDLVIAALRSANRLGADVALSHRQLGRAVRDVTAGQRASLESIASLAERVTYSRFVPDEDELARAFATSRALVAGVAR